MDYRTTNYIPIYCGDYEILESICLYQYDVEISLDEQLLIGKANGLEIIEKAKFLVIKDSLDALKHIRLIKSARSRC